MIDRAIYPKQKTIHCVRDVFKKSQKTVEPPMYLGLFTKNFGISGIQKFTPMNPTFRLFSSLDFKILFYGIIGGLHSGSIPVYYVAKFLETCP